MDSYHYRSNVNGKVTEMHLCPECANASKETADLFSGTDRMFEDMFSEFFGRRSLMSPFGGLGGFGGFGSLSRLMMPTLMLPRIELYIEDPKTEEVKTEAPKTEEKKEIDPEMAKRRELNMLREQMKESVSNEEFEKAAELIDKIRAIENENKE